eukprot:Tamp_21223.p2 GENE.Tamp_21223~~Tamp_21223.p2  ORF type:complete len:155 (-),score=28.67 Tamp_21223:61-525(-)
MLRCDMQIGHVRIRRKAVFVLSQLLRSNPVLRAAVIQIQEGDSEVADKGVLPELINIMTVGPEGAPDPQIVEFAISAVVTLLEPVQPSTAPTTPQHAATPRGTRLRLAFPLLTDLLHKRIEALCTDGAEDGDSDMSEARRLLVLIGAPPTAGSD